MYKQCFSINDADGLEILRICIVTTNQISEKVVEEYFVVVDSPRVGRNNVQDPFGGFYYNSKRYLRILYFGIDYVHI